MAITYTWKVREIKVRDQGPHTNAVVQTYWEKRGTDEDGDTGVFMGATPFSAENVSPDDFVALENLTEETVLQWIQAEVVGDYEQHVNERIQEGIDHQKSPVSDASLPWQSGD